MKRTCTMLTVLTVLILLCGCSKTNVSENADITLCFVYEKENITVLLEDCEAKQVAQILDRNSYAPAVRGTPSCGFDQEMSFHVGSRVYAIARDGCNCIQDFGNQRYFDISIEDMAYIHGLFEKYGGYFPCV